MHRWRPRRYEPEHVLVPARYTVELVAEGFNEPVHCTFDDAGGYYVIECGHKIEAKPRVLKVDVDTGEWEVFFELPDERWNVTDAVTGACWHDGHLYLMNTDTLSRSRSTSGSRTSSPTCRARATTRATTRSSDPTARSTSGRARTRTPPSSAPTTSPNEWLRRFPQEHDVPGQDLVLTGQNYEMPNVLGNPATTVKTGTYVPFGTETTPRQVIKGDVRCNGSVLRCNPDGSGLELVAWGLRNPYGIAFAPDGRLFACDHGIDERNNRHIIGDHKDFYEIIEGAWYGWPDFASGIRLDEPYWGGPAWVVAASRFSPSTQTPTHPSRSCSCPTTPALTSNFHDHG